MGRNGIGGGGHSSGGGGHRSGGNHGGGSSGLFHSSGHSSKGSSSNGSHNLFSSNASHDIGNDLRNIGIQIAAKVAIEVASNVIENRKWKRYKKGKKYSSLDAKYVGKTHNSNDEYSTYKYDEDYVDNSQAYNEQIAYENDEYEIENKKKKSKTKFLAKILLCLGIFASFTGIAKSIDAKNKVQTDKQYQVYAQEQYKEIFDEREDGMLIFIADEGKTTYQTIVCGSSAKEIKQSMEDYYYTCYDNNYNDDLSIQLSNAIHETCILLSDELHTDAISKVDSTEAYNGKCITDNLRLINNPFYVNAAFKELYETTGVQAYVLLVPEATVAKATETTTAKVKTFIVIFVSSELAIYLLALYINHLDKKKKEQEALDKRLDEPHFLETYKEIEVRDLSEKYDREDILAARNISSDITTEFTDIETSNTEISNTDTSNKKDSEKQNLRI